MVFTPVSLVAPAREVSILFAALLGAHFLKEGDLDAAPGGRGRHGPRRGGADRRVAVPRQL